MYQTKIFNGSFSGCGGQPKRADDMFNDWIKSHPNIEIIRYVYRHERYGDHSIAILYKEDMKEDNQ